MEEDLAKQLCGVGPGSHLVGLSPVSSLAKIQALSTTGVVHESISSSKVHGVTPRIVFFRASGSKTRSEVIS